MANFTDVRVTTGPDGGYYLTETVTDYNGYPRQYFIDNRPVGSSPANYGPVRHGGMYQVKTIRWDNSRPIWGHTAPGDNNENANQMQAHVVTVTIPGPTGEPGSIAWPDGLYIGPDFIRPVASAIPAFAALPGKLCGMHRFADSDTADDYLARGATHVAHADGLDAARRWETTGMAGPIPGDYANVDEMGEERFRELSDPDIDNLAGAVAPNTGVAFADFEKTGKYGDPNTQWSIPLDDQTLPKYFRFLRKIRAIRPGMLLAEDYRQLVYNRFFPNAAGLPEPTLAKYMNQYADPESAAGPAYRHFSYEGQTVSLRDVFNLYGVNAYPDAAYNPDLSQNYFLHQCYAMIHATRITRKLVPGSAKVIWYAWDGSDTEHVFQKLYQRASGGWLWRNNRLQPPAWFGLFLGLFGDLVADGQFLFHDQAPASSNPDRPFWVPDGSGWEPDADGNPDPRPADGSGNSGAYPREHRNYYCWVMVGKYMAAQLADVVAAGYTLHDCPVSVSGSGFSAHHGEPQICYSAAEKLSIWVEIRGNNGRSALIGVHPFGMPGVRVPMLVQTGRGNRAVSLSGQWPAAFRLVGDSVL